MNPGYQENDRPLDEERRKLREAERAQARQESAAD
jgi:hypothetical protein